VQVISGCPARNASHKRCGRVSPLTGKLKVEVPDGSQILYIVMELEERDTSSFNGKEYLDWCAARAKLMRTALVNGDDELLEQTFQSVVGKVGEDEAIDLLTGLKEELSIC
jgi:hypothetical protein